MDGRSFLWFHFVFDLLIKWNDELLFSAAELIPSFSLFYFALSEIHVHFCNALDGAFDWNIFMCIYFSFISDLRSLGTWNSQIASSTLSLFENGIGLRCKSALKASIWMRPSSVSSPATSEPINWARLHCALRISCDASSFIRFEMVKLTYDEVQYVLNLCFSFPPVTRNVNSAISSAFGLALQSACIVDISHRSKNGIHALG